MQRSAEAVYAHIQSWLGEEISEAGAVSASRWPTDHLDAFAEQWPDSAGTDLDAEIEALSDGQLRPISSLSGPGPTRRQTILGLLLYTPTIIVPADDLVQDWFVGGLLDDDARRFLRDKISWLAKIKPLVESGVIVFSRRRPGDEWSALFDNFDPVTEPRFRLLDDMTRTDWERGGWSWPDMDDDALAGMNRAVATTMGTSLELATRGAGQALALDKVEEIAFSHVLEGKRLKDERVSTLQRLGQFELPDFGANTDLLLSLRSSNDWERWRVALSDGVSLVSDIGDTENGAQQASRILADHLTESLYALSRSTDRSPALSAARVGSKGFILSGVWPHCGSRSSGGG